MAMTIPCSTPTKATPRKAASDSSPSTRSIRSSRRTAARSSSDDAATITTAASVDDGRYWVTPGASRMNATISRAPTTPTSWLLAPACSATGVRDELADTGNPPSRPPARLATPTAPISWLPSTFSP